MVDKKNQAKIPSLLSAVNQLKQMLTKQEKVTWLGIATFAMVISLLEVITASVIVVLAQVLNQPEVGQKYLSLLGMGPDLSQSRIILYMAVSVGFIYVLKNILAGLESFYQNMAIQRINYQFKNRILERYANADYGVSLTRNSSQGMQIISGDTEQMFSSGMIALASILSEALIFICLVGLIIYMDPSLAFIISVVAFFLFLVITKGLLPHFYRFGQMVQEESLHSTRNLFQFFHAFKEIIILGKRDFFINAYEVHSRRKVRIQAIQTSINALPRLVIELLFVGLFVTSIAVLCFENESPVQMMGVLGGYLYAGFRLMPGLNRMINQLNTFKATIPSIERVYYDYTTIAASNSYENIPDFCFDDTITLKNVNFKYINTPINALSAISLDIKKGECLGIIGETGSGKSTLIDLILGLLKPSEGSICVDNRYPVASLQWHQKIGYVPQSTYLIDDTIEANIAFGEKSIDYTRLHASIHAAQLTKLVDALPQGTKTIVGERGVRLSGGERQRISIARALYREPDVLIFDEATSALDNKTEEKLMQTIHHVSQSRTVIMIAHRLTTLKNCHRIVALEKGSIKEITSYDKIQQKVMHNA